MAIFQKSVIKKHLNSLDKELVEKAYQKFKENYRYDKIEKNKKLKEEEYQDGFLRDLFVDVLGYTLKTEDNYNLVREFRNQGDGKKADGAIVREHAPQTPPARSENAEPSEQTGKSKHAAISEPAVTSELAPMSVAHSIPQLLEHAPVTRKREKTQHHLWTQKFGQKEITSNEQLENTIENIKNNRKKHQLPENKELQTNRSMLRYEKLCCSRQHAFRTENSGGFDVVIGNPSDGAKITKKDLTFILSKQGKDGLTKDEIKISEGRLL